MKITLALRDSVFISDFFCKTWDLTKSPFYNTWTEPKPSSKSHSALMLPQLHTVFIGVQLANDWVLQFTTKEISINVYSEEIRILSEDYQLLFEKETSQVRHVLISPEFTREILTDSGFSKMNL